MNTEKLREQISHLDLSEQLLLVEDIWDTIARNNADIPMPQWQKIELDERYKQYKNGQLELHDWKNVHQKLRNKYK